MCITVECFDIIGQQNKETLRIIVFPLRIITNFGHGSIISLDFASFIIAILKTSQ